MHLYCWACPAGGCWFVQVLTRCCDLGGTVTAVLAVPLAVLIAHGEHCASPTLLPLGAPWGAKHPDGSLQEKPWGLSWFSLP